MSIEKNLLVRARPHMLAAKAQALVNVEASKGCRPELAAEPVALEPLYQPVRSLDRNDEGRLPFVPEGGDCEAAVVRQTVWISPEQKCDWNRSELLLKELASVRHRVGLEFVGNERGISLELVSGKEDLLIVKTAFQSQFEQCELTPVDECRLAPLGMDVWEGAAFYDFFPPPPYSHLFTMPEELKRSPYAVILRAMAELPEPAVGIYQVITQPVSPDHDWHQNVQTLLDLEFAVKLMGGLASAQRYAQQIPSGDLRHMALDVAVKSHRDKPFFAAALRMAVLNGGKGGGRLLQTLAVMGNLIQHGGRPLLRLTDGHYRDFLCPSALRDMFLQGRTYRPGFLLNSLELTSFMHIPPVTILEPFPDAIEPLEPLSPSPRLSTGTTIGYCFHAGTHEPVCVPDDMRPKHLHAIGKTGCGKSTLLEHMVIGDVTRGHGVAVLDPHGGLIQRLLCLLPRDAVDRVIYLDPGDSQWIPIWNPLESGAAMGPDRVADEVVRAFKSFVTGWGDRLEHLLRHAVYAVAHLPGSSLLDVVDLLRKGSVESAQLRELIKNTVDNETARNFWRLDFDKYAPSDVRPAQHKLSKLLMAGPCSLMLSQSQSTFDLRDIMDTGKVLLVNLAGLGPEVREILGCFILSLLHLAALSRGMRSAGGYRRFHIYCDEAHRFLTEAIEDLIAETRKFDVSLTLAHQFLNQFTGRKVGALSNTGSAVIFNVDAKDAQYLTKDLHGKVKVEDLITLEVGQAIARVDTHVVRLRTFPPFEIPNDSARALILDRSRSLYYRPTEDVRRAIRRRWERWGGPAAAGIEPASGVDPRGGESGEEEDDFTFDVF